MRILIVCAVAALTAIVAVFVMKKIDGPWDEDSSIHTAVAGAAAGLMSVIVAKKLRKEA
jgi:hypothetical protein